MAKKKNGSEPDDLITLTEAAELRGYAGVSAISRLIERNRLRVFERYGKRLVSRAEVEAFEPAKGGRPSSKKGTKP
jgi:hypothetical protein